MVSLTPLDAERELVLTLALKVLVDFNQQILEAAIGAVVHQVVPIHYEPLSEIFVDLFPQQSVFFRTPLMLTHTDAPVDPRNQLLVDFLHASNEEQGFHFLLVRVEGVLLIVIFQLTCDLLIGVGPHSPLSQMSFQMLKSVGVREILRVLLELLV